MPAYPAIALGSFATLVKRPLVVEEDATVRSLGVRWYGRGAYVAEVKPALHLRAARFAVHANDLIYNDMWARNGSVAIVPSELDGSAASAHFPTWVLDHQRVYSSYLALYFQTPTFWAACEAFSQGSTGRNAITKTLFRTLTVPLPPLDEQHRIVARLDALASRISEAQRLRQQAIEEAEALMEAGVTAAFKTLAGTPTHPLKTLTSKIGSGSTPAGGRAAYPAEGVPFIRSQNVRMRRFQWQDIAFIHVDTHARMLGTQVLEGDVLLNITGASIGRVACVPDDMPEGNVNQHVAIVRPIAALLPRFLMYWLSEANAQKHINSEQKGATRQGFTKAQIEAMCIPVPSPAEQRRIVAHLDALKAKVDALKALQAQSAAELDALLPSLLDRAFKGEL